MTMLRNALPPQLTADEWMAAVRTVTICVLAIIFTLTLCLACFFRQYVDPTILATVGVTAGGVFGYLFGKRTPTSEPSKAVQPLPLSNDATKEGPRHVKD